MAVTFDDEPEATNTDVQLEKVTSGSEGDCFKSRQ